MMRSREELKCLKGFWELWENMLFLIETDRFGRYNDTSEQEVPSLWGEFC